MKTSIRWRSAISAALGLAVLASCSSTPSHPLSTSRAVPAAEGTVSVRKDSNQNTDLTIEVKHLAPADRLAVGASTYVVWLAPQGGTKKPQNLGSLAVNKNLNGKLTIITPHQSFDLFVTAEPSVNTPQPTGERVLWTQVNERKTG